MTGHHPERQMTVDVSVVVPTYNRADVIDRCIESVLSQSFEDFELVIVDDGSTDETASVIKGYDDARIRHLTQENRGANAARMTGIRAASGDIISLLDSDDRLHPSYLDRVVKQFRREKADCAGIATSYREVAPDGTVKSINYTPNHRIRLEHVVDGNPIGSFSCTTFRRDVFDAVGGLDEQLEAAQDYDFYLRVLEHGYYIAGVNDVLVDRIETEDRISADLERKERAFKRLVDKHGDKLLSSRIADHHTMLGFIHADNDDLQSAAAAFRTAIEHDPTDLLNYYHYLSARGGPVVWKHALSLKRSVNGVVYRFKR